MKKTLIFPFSEWVVEKERNRKRGMGESYGDGGRGRESEGRIKKDNVAKRGTGKGLAGDYRRTSI